MGAQLKPVTVRFTAPAYDAIREIASEHGLPMADVVRRGFDAELVKYLDAVRYVDYEQGREIQRQLMALANILQGISGDLRRIGINYNQDIRLRWLAQRSGTTTAQQAQEAEHNRQRLLADMDRLIARYEAATTEAGGHAMPYTRITGTRNGAEAIRYALDGKGHNGNKDRNQIVSGVNMFPGAYTAQMDRYWRRASRKNKVQVRRVIQSFSRAEANPDNPNDIERINRIGMEFARKAYPGRQAIVCTQIDGKSGLVHNHILVNNISMIDSVVPGVPVGNGQYRDVLVPAGRGCIDEQTYFSYVKRHTNEIAAKYIPLDLGKGRDAKSTQAERTKREQGAYIWKDDLRERITKAQAEAADIDDFLSRLPAHGVAGTVRHSKKRGDYILYELTDTSGFGPGEKLPPNLKSKSYKLGDAYGPEGLRFQDRTPENEQDRAAVAAARKVALEDQRAARRARVLQDAARLMADVGYGEDGTGRDGIVIS